MTAFEIPIRQRFPDEDGEPELLGYVYDHGVGVTLAQLRIGDRCDAVPLPEFLAMASREAPHATQANPSTGDQMFMQSLTREQRRTVLSREPHVLMVRDGIPDVPGADARYLESVPRARRKEAKAAELGVDPGTINRWLTAYRERGRRGLVHGNTRLDWDAWAELPGPVQHILTAHVANEAEASKKTLVNEYAMVLDDLRRHGLAVSEEHNTDRLGDRLPEAAALLPFKPFKAALKVLRGNKPTGQDAKTRQSEHKRPVPTVKHRGFDFADVIMVDATRVDIEVRLGNGQIRRWVWALFALCPATKYIWLRLIAEPPRGKHLGLLLHDVMSPRPFGDVVDAYAPLTAAPREWRVNAWPPVFEECPPSVVPGIVIADHGPEEENQHVLSLMGENGFVVEWGRSASPTDKADVESAIKTFALMTQVVPAHIGNAVKNSPSGKHRKNAKAVSFVALQRMFTAFSFWYSAQPHSGLPHPHYPDRVLTPSEAVHESLISGNVPRVAGNPNTARYFLERTKQTPHESGVSFKYLTYVPEDRDDLDAIIKASHGRGRGGKALKQVFFYDSDNPLRIHWNRPNTFDWVTLYAPGGDGRAELPFGDYADAVTTQ